MLLVRTIAMKTGYEAEAKGISDSRNLCSVLESKEDDGTNERDSRAEESACGIDDAIKPKSPSA